MDLIRKVQEQDWAAIEDLVKQAFASVPYSDGTEAALVDRLRQGPSFIPDLALMAERKDQPAVYPLYKSKGIPRNNPCLGTPCCAALFSKKRDWDRPCKKRSFPCSKGWICLCSCFRRPCILWPFGL